MVETWSMANEKNLSPDAHVSPYIPPRLVKGTVWYIVYYHADATGAWKRERKTFSLNRIADKRRRLERAKEIIAQIEARFAAGDSSTEAAELSALQATPLAEAIRFGASILMQSPKKETVKSFRMARDMLLNFVREKKMESAPVVAFTQRHAQAFLDAALRRGVSNTTHNNYRAFAGGIFLALVRRDYLPENPFRKIRKRDAEEKSRRPFTAAERATVLEALERDYWLHMLVMLHAYCLIRRTECYRLRFRDFNLADGYITLPKSATKNKRAEVVTIPHELLDRLRLPEFSAQPGNFLLFGKHGKPHPDKNAGESTYKTKHRELLERLQKEGKLPDISGLSLYSWKDTGMTEFAKHLRPLELRDHARHKSVEQSLQYYHAEKIIEGVKKVRL